MKANEIKNGKKLNMEEMEMVDGGWDWKNFLGGAGAGGVFGAICGAVIGICTGPVGWCALGGAALGAAGVGAATASAG